MIADTRGGLFAEQGSFADLLSTNSYVDVGILPCMLLKTKKFYFSCATNSVKITILGSMDGGISYPITAEAEFTLTAATPISKTITDLFTHLKVQVKAAVNGAQGTLTTFFMGQNT